MTPYETKIHGRITLALQSFVAVSRAKTILFLAIPTLLILFLISGCSETKSNEAQLKVTTTLENETPYSQKRIEKHLEALFSYKIKHGDSFRAGRYLPFKKEVLFYLDFGFALKNHVEKRKIVVKVLKEFEQRTSTKITISQSNRPSINERIKNDNQITTYRYADEFAADYIYFNLLTKVEIANSLKEGFWYQQLILGKPKGTLEKALKSINRQTVSYSLANVNRIGKQSAYKVLALLELTDYRNQHFEAFLRKQLYLTFLQNSIRKSIPDFIVPSTFNKKQDDFSKQEISKFDWVLLDEFYHNPELIEGMPFKDVIPILAQAIAKRMKGTDHE